MENIPIPREQLYREVWNESMVKVAARYGISSNFLARVCERLRVPHPERGYWAKLEHGKAPERPPLPEALPGDEIEWTRDGEPRRAAPKAPSPSELGQRRRPAERPKTHQLISEARVHFGNVKVLENGYLRPAKRAMADIVTSSDILLRILNVSDELYLTLEDFGHRVTLAPQDQELRRIDIYPDEYRESHRPWYPDRATVTFVGTLAFGLTVFETKEQATVEYSDGKYVKVRPASPAKRGGFMPEHRYTSQRDMPSGKICIRVYSPYPVASWKREWTEESAGGLSSKLTAIVKVLESEAPAIITLIEKGERQAEIDRKECERQLRKFEQEMAQQKLDQAREESQKELLEIIKDWSLGKRIQEFLAEIAEKSAGLDKKECSAIGERLKMAQELLGGVDALERLRAWRSPSEVLKQE